MSSIDPQSPELRRAVDDRINTRRADILRGAAHDLDIEGKCRTVANNGDTPTWDQAVEYLRVLALGEEGRR